MNYDLIVIGAGPGGYACAIRAAQIGMKVTLVDKNAALGGTCLNIGCIPSKALLYTSECYRKALTQYPHFGVKTKGVELDLLAMMAFKDEVVSTNVKGLSYLMQKHKINVIIGNAVLRSQHEVEISGTNQKQVIKATSIVLATGSKPISLPGLMFDEKTILSSTGALALQEVPKRLTVVGGGVIGVELGSVWSRLGSEVTIVEYQDRLLSEFDHEVSLTFRKYLEQQGVRVLTSTAVAQVNSKKQGVELQLESKQVETPNSTLEASKVLVAIGRVPYTDGLNLSALGIKQDEKGRVVVSDKFQTNLPTVYAIGDIISGPMLAHKAEEEGIAVAEILGGQSPKLHAHLIPNVVYTDPEIASIGDTEEALKRRSAPYAVGKFPFQANGRARANCATEGFVKILADRDTDRILGVHILGHEASNLIAELGIAMEFGATSEDLARTCHAHPTLSEAIKEAALAVHKRAIHL